MLFLCLFTLHSHPPKNLSNSDILSKRYQEGLDYMSTHVATSSQGNCYGYLRMGCKVGL